MVMMGWGGKLWIYVWFCSLLLGVSSLENRRACNWLPLVKGPNESNPTLSCVLLPEKEFDESALSLLKERRRPSLLLKCRGTPEDPGEFPRRVLNLLRSLKGLGKEGAREVLIVDCDLSRIPPQDALPGSVLSLAVRRCESLRVKPEDLIPLRRFKSLDLSDNLLGTLPPGTICPIKDKLLHLNLSGNKFKRLEDSSVAGNNTKCDFDKLLSLQLSGNSLKEIPYRSFITTSKDLRNLRLDHNELIVVTENAFDGLKKLRILDLSHNSLNLLTEGTFESLSSLRELYLHDNRLTTVNSGHFRGLENLLLLNLSYNALGRTESSTGGNSGSSGGEGVMVFEGLYRCQTLDLSHNQIRNFYLNDKSNLTALKHLDLSYNRMYVMEDGIFRHLPNLETLYLTGNRMHTVHSGAFYGLHHLKTLRMDHNELKTLPRDVFAYAQKLQELYLNDNYFEQIPELRALNELRTLDMSRNRIRSVRTENFAHMPNLMGLRLPQNRITEIKNDTFKSVPKLRMLNLSRNKIASISQSSFEPLSKLKYLRLDSNKLDDINGLLTTQHHLQWLNVSSNQLQWFDYAFIPKSLLWLDLSHNQLEELGNFYDMQSGFSLLHLDASNNKLQKLDKFSLQKSLQEVKFQNNIISEIAPSTFLDLNNLTSADLRSNNISTLALYSLGLRLKEGSTAEMRLSDNPLVCDCEMQWLQKINEISRNSPRLYPQVLDFEDLSCVLIDKHRKPNDLSPVPKYSIMSVRPDQFLCQYETHCFVLCICCSFFACDCRMNCPDGCSCFNDQTWSSNIIQCGNRNHTTVPDMIPMDATSIYLDGNPHLTDISGDTFIGRKHLTSLYLNNSGITEISNRTFSGLEELLILKLDHNKLKSLSGGEFMDLTSLKQLHLDNNQLASVYKDTFKPLKNLEVLTLNDNKIKSLPVWNMLPSEASPHSSIKELSLASNPWPCTCDFVQNVQRAIRDHRDRIRDADSLECESESGKANIGKYNVTCADVMAVRSQDDMIIFGLLPVIFLAFFAILALLTLCLLALCCRNKFKLWMHSKYGFRVSGPAEAHDKDRKYDAYIHYAQNDDQFTRQLLTRNLEDYRLCLRHRDIDEKSAAALGSAAKSSGRVVLLGTPSYLADKAAQSEFKTVVEAIEPRRRPDQILVIVKEDVLGAGMQGPRRQEELKRKLQESPLLKDATFMSWGSESFWNRFRYNLPESPLNANVNKSHHRTYVSSSSHTNGYKKPPPPNPFLEDESQEQSTYQSSLSAPLNAATSAHTVDSTSSTVQQQRTNLSSSSTVRVNEKSSYNEDYDDMWTYLKGNGNNNVQGSGDSSLSTRSTTDGINAAISNSAINHSYSSNTNRTNNRYNMTSSVLPAPVSTEINNTLNNNTGAFLLQDGRFSSSGDHANIDDGGGGMTTTTTTTTTIIKRHIVENPFDNLADAPAASSSKQHLLHLSDSDYMSVSGDPIYHTLDARNRGGRLLEEEGSKVKKQSTVYIDSDLKVVYPPRGVDDGGERIVNDEQERLLGGGRREYNVTYVPSPAPGSLSRSRTKVVSDRYGTAEATSSSYRTRNDSYYI